MKVVVAEPPGVVTLTGADPALPGGVVTVIEVAVLVPVLIVADAPPKVTAALLRLEPEIVTVVPPPVDPLAGLSESPDGGAT